MTLKFRSSLTLFAKSASDNSDRMLFQEALDQFYSGMLDPRTLKLLGSSPRAFASIGFGRHGVSPGLMGLYCNALGYLHTSLSPAVVLSGRRWLRVR